MRCMHSLKQRKKGLEGILAMEIDMSKNFVRVSWRFLKTLMRRMGFDHQWSDRVMQCVEFVSYMVKVNGSMSNTVIPERGIT